MKHFKTLFVAILVFLGGTVIVWSLYFSSEEVIQDAVDFPVDESQTQTRSQSNDDNPENTQEMQITDQTQPTPIVPDELFDELEVSDIEFLSTSIANQADLWRAFLDAPIPLSDPFFEFGCSEYQDTGGQLVVNLFVDEASQYWVTESVGEKLIGIGEISFPEYDLITAYRTQSEEIACLQLLRRNYDHYHLFSENVSMQLFANAVDLYPEDYDLLVTVDNVYLPLPKEFIEEVNGYTGAGREPVLLDGKFIIGFADNGINIIDLQAWKTASLFGLAWEDLRGVSSIVMPSEDAFLAFAYQTWEEMPQAMVVVYDLRAGIADYAQYTRYASLGWMMGSNEVFALENASDLEFLSPYALTLTEYPNFNEDVTEGLNPYVGETENYIWEFQL